VKAATLTQFSPTSHFTENRKENKTFEEADTPQSDNENSIGWTLKCRTVKYGNSASSFRQRKRVRIWPPGAKTKKLFRTADASRFFKGTVLPSTVYFVLKILDPFEGLLDFGA
jgi:hypothetical protein